MRAVVSTLLLTLGLVVTGCGDEPAPPSAGPQALAVRAGERPIGGFLLTAAQPDAARLHEVARAGMRILALQPRESDPVAAESIAAAHGAPCVRIPWTARAAADPALRARVHDAFDAAARDAQAAYAYGARLDEVGAAWALYRAEREGMELSAAIADGRRVGLDALEPLVRKILAAPK